MGVLDISDLDDYYVTAQPFHHTRSYETINSDDASLSDEAEACVESNHDVAFYIADDTMVSSGCSSELSSKFLSWDDYLSPAVCDTAFCADASFIQYEPLRPPPRLRYVCLSPPAMSHDAYMTHTYTELLKTKKTSRRTKTNSTSTRHRVKRVLAKLKATGAKMFSRK